jgi:hypothetical protein
MHTARHRSTEDTLQHVRRFGSAIAGIALIAAIAIGTAASSHQHAIVHANGYDTSPGSAQGPSEPPSPTP